MTTFNIFTAILTILALTGVVLNIKKKILCFYIWLITNISWATVDLYKGIPMQSLLFIIYAALAVYGICEWRKDEKKKEKTNSNLP
jgi:nicotinamide riboside transporter PnuC